MCGPQLTERRLYSLHSRAGHARPLLSNKRSGMSLFAGIPFLSFSLTAPAAFSITDVPLSTAGICKRRGGCAIIR